MQQKFEFIDIDPRITDAELWEDLLLIEDDYDPLPLPKLSQSVIHLSDEVPF